MALSRKLSRLLSNLKLNTPLLLPPPCWPHRDLSKFRDVLFRLDGDEGAVGLSTHLCNLSRLMENGPNRWVNLATYDAVGGGKREPVMSV